MGSKVFTLEKYMHMRHDRKNFDAWLSNRLAEGHVLPDEWVEHVRQQDDARRAAKAKAREVWQQLPLVERYEQVRQQNPEIAWRWGKNEIVRRNNDEYTNDILSLEWSKDELASIHRAVEHSKLLQKEMEEARKNAEVEKEKREQYRQQVLAMTDEELQKKMEDNLLRVHDISTPESREHVIKMLLDGDEDTVCEGCQAILSIDDAHYEDEEYYCDDCYLKWLDEVAEEAEEFAEEHCQIEDGEWPEKLSFSSFQFEHCGYSTRDLFWNDTFDMGESIYKEACFDAWERRYEELYGPRTGNWHEEQELLEVSENAMEFSDQASG